MKKIISKKTFQELKKSFRTTNKQIRYDPEKKEIFVYQTYKMKEDKK